MRPAVQAQDRIPESVVIARVTAYALAATVASLWMVDADLWGHLRFGLDIFRDRALPSSDPYSFTSDVAWINHEWLSEAFMGTAYTLGGTQGLRLLKILIVGSAYVLIAHRLRGTEAPARWWLLAVAIVATMPLAITLRPQLWTILALTGITVTMHWPLTRLFILWPVIFALWANLHGGWIVGLGVVGAWAAGTVLDSRAWRQILPLTGLCAACLLATLLTPYGFELWRFLWATVGFERRDIVEWRPVWAMNSWLVVLIWSLTAATAGIVVRRTAFSWVAILPVLMLGVSSLKVSRLIGLFGIVVVVMLGSRWRNRPAPAFQPALLACLTVTAILPAGAMLGTNGQCLSVTDPDTTAAAALHSAQPGRLMVPFNWGQFAIWHFGPRLKVSMDGRRETVYSHNRLGQLLPFDHGDPSVMTFIRTERPEYVWLPREVGAPLFKPLTQAGYRRDVETDRSVILTRSDLPRISAASQMAPCFP